MARLLGEAKTGGRDVGKLKHGTGLKHGAWDIGVRLNSDPRSFGGWWIKNGTGGEGGDPNKTGCRDVGWGAETWHWVGGGGKSLKQGPRVRDGGLKLKVIPAGWAGI